METILGGLLISLISVIVGVFLGSHSKVQTSECDRRQKDCQRLLIERIDHLKDKIDELTRIVNNKILEL